MTIEFTERNRPAHNRKWGADEFTVSAGQSLKIETSPDGEEVLDAECPAGKTWTVYVSVKIEESNA